MSDNNKGQDDFFVHLCQNVRRFRDQHISSMLHSLIGLPSMVTPPATGTWVIIDEELRPKKERAYSDGDGRLEGKTMEEIQNMKATWIAERDGSAGGGRGVEAVEGDKTKTESGGSSSSSSASSSAGPGNGRAIYVFRFPSSSSSDGCSDYYSPDARRQIERLHGQMLRSFYGDESFPFSPFQSLFGLLHPFMFSPFAGLPRHYNYGYHDPIEQGLDELDPWRRMQDEELRWRRKMYKHFNQGYNNTTGVEDKAGDGVENTMSKAETQLSLPEPPPEPQQGAFKPALETELDLYEDLDLISTGEKSRNGRSSTSRHIVGISSSTESRTLPDGSTFTKTIKITRYDDGTEERIENEHRTPARRELSERAIQGNRRDAIVAEEDDGNAGASVSAFPSDRDWRGDGDERKKLHDFERRVLDYFMRSPFFGDEKRVEPLVTEDVPRQASYESTKTEERFQQDENHVPRNEPVPQPNHLPAGEDKSGRNCGWFWRK